MEEFAFGGRVISDNRQKAEDNCDGGDLQFSSSCFYFPSEKRVHLAAESEDGTEMLSSRRERKV